MEDLFGFKHITGLIYLLILYIIVYLVIKRFSKNSKKTFKILAVSLLLLELSKYTYLIINNGHIDKIYIPINFCNLFLYTFTISAFFKGKISKFLMPFNYSGAILAGSLALLLPTNILGNPNTSWFVIDNFLYTLSFVYHGLLIFTAFYIVKSKLYKPKMIDILSTIPTILFFAIIARFVNKSLGTDFMFLNTAKGNPLQFLLNDYGYYIYIIIMLVLMILLTSLSFIPFIRKNIKD